ncbi:MAG: efflux transporter outer rane subunit [Sphingomonas bacterium]|nr:efflux transporter outer membrane subunit [Sphingomonas bacterium]MDB5689011.1 efflux transporter outer rane subunit [Sphingomonas bacterium]
MRSRIAAAGFAALLSGCSLAPRHVQPALPTPLEYPPETSPEGGTRSAAEIGWREFFRDPRLQALIASALENNRDIRIAVARIEEARGQYRVTDAARLPGIGVGGSATRQRIPLGSIAAGSIGGVGTGVGTGTGGGAVVTDPDGGAASTPNAIVTNNYSVNVGVSSFELDFWGRVRNLSEAARNSYLATISAERAFRLSLIRDLATAFLTSRELAERAELADRTLASRREGLRIAKLRLDAGVTSALDYRQAETLLTQAETELAALRNARVQTRNQVQLLVGRPIVETELPDALTLKDQGIVRDIGAGLPSALLVNRPDIVGAEDQLRAARANIGAARAAFFPSISLTGSLGFASTDLSSLVGSSGLAWSFGPSIRLPIFDWGATKGNLTVAQARENIAVANYERTVQGAFREVADALAGRRYLAEQIAAQERATEAQRNLANLARLRYQNGVAQYIEVLDAERNLFAAEQALITLRRQDLQNLVSLYIALGGGLRAG